jgi:glyoxylase-like metal-dependent hydrolase (beta-lactamase superfamily II)
LGDFYSPNSAFYLLKSTPGSLTMDNFICTTCGTQFAESATPPAHCPICMDERQYIGWQGQQWTTLAALRRDHHNRIKLEEPGLTGIGTEPGFAIGQRALLVQTPAGNVLWDCISLLDEATLAAVQALGGIAAIAISHPHYYSSLVEWSRAFAAPVYLHEADRQWVMRPDPAIRFWAGESQPLPGGLTLIRCGGHFAGGTVLHWPAGAAGQGALLTGDILQVVSDRRYVSFMYSYPNLIPLPAAKVRRIVAAVAPYPFDRIYGAWWDRVVVSEAKAAVERSATRYLAALAAETDLYHGQKAGA